MPFRVDVDLGGPRAAFSCASVDPRSVDGARHGCADCNKLLRLEAKRKTPAQMQVFRILIQLGHRSYPRYFLSRSRISDRSFSDVVGAGGAAGWASSFFFSLFMPWMAKNRTNAIIRKFQSGRDEISVR